MVGEDTIKNQSVAKSGRPFKCPFCSCNSVTGLYIEPLCFDDLEQAIELRKQEAKEAAAKRAIASDDSGKRHREDEIDYHVEAIYIVFSQGRKTLTSSLADADGLRTGRWTEEEVAYVDHLVTSFDQGQLPISNGSKLSSFLGDMLLCKASRLTKKMKNAKLSTRSFQLLSPKAETRINDEEFEVLSALQKRFIETMPTKASQLELRFNITKQWRTYFSDLCVQVGYPLLDVNDWIASLELLEHKTAQSEEKMRNVRRRRMGFHLRNNETYLSTSEIKTQSNTLPVQSRSNIQNNEVILGKHLLSSRMEDAFGKTTKDMCNDDHESLLDQTSHKIDGDESLAQYQIRSYSEDLDEAFMTLMDDEDSVISGHPALTKSRDPFLQAIAMYLEENDLPFQHADVWVPSFVQEGDPRSGVKLLHAGHVTRKDQMKTLFSSLQNFGEYSKSFSFAPGQGLPGRVYESNKVSWEFELGELNPSVFARKDGAMAYGVKTATAIPLSTAGVGRMVVVLYSCTNIVEDPNLASRCASALAKYSPEPKWKLVIEIDENNTGVDSLQKGSQGTNVMFPGNSSSASTVSAEQEDSDARIVTLLGEQLSILSGISPGESTSSKETTNNLLSQLMTIRLLLLRPADKRSAEENEMIGILKSSFNAYSQSSNRNERELAKILAKEWCCLKSAFFPRNEAPSYQLSGSSRDSPSESIQLQEKLRSNPFQAGGQHSSPESSPVVTPQVSKNLQLPAVFPSSNGRGMVAPPMSFPDPGQPTPSSSQTMLVHDHSLPMRKSL